MRKSSWVIRFEILGEEMGEMLDWRQCFEGFGCNKFGRDLRQIGWLREHNGLKRDLVVLSISNEILPTLQYCPTGHVYSSAARCLRIKRGGARLGACDENIE